MGVKNNSNSEYFIDIYGNKYPEAYIARHGYYKSSSKHSVKYLFDKKYFKCEGQLAWSKEEKNREGAIWIEFYSVNELIYTTRL